MNTRYYDLINQTFYFPQEEFTLNKDNLTISWNRFNEISRTVWNPFKVHLLA